MTRYVVGELMTPTILALFLYTFVVMMNHLFLVAERSMAKNLGWELTLRLFMVGIPKLLVMTIPMAVLLGVMIAVGRISADNEWVALQGAGQGPGRLLKPIALFGLIATLLSLTIYGVVVPRANYALRNLRGQVLFASNLASDLKPRVFYSTLPNTVLYVSDIRKTDRERLEGVFLVRTEPGEGLTEMFLARSGDLYPDQDNPGWLILDLYDGVDHVYDPEEPDTYRHWAFDSRQLRIDVASYLRGFLAPPEKSVPDLSPGELLTELSIAKEAQAALAISVAEAEGKDAGNKLLLANHRLKVTTIELHQRLALSLAAFFLALLALPLGITRVRSGKGAGFALSLLVILVYWIAFTLGRNQSSLGNLPPWLGPWMGNLVIFPWSLVSLRRLQRQTGERAGIVARILAMFPKKRPAERRLPAAGAARPSDESAPLSNLSGTPSRFVGRLDQYISFSYLRILLVTMFSAYMVYVLVEFKNLIEDAMKTDQPLRMALFAEYFVYFLPGVLWVVLPISCLVGGVVTFTLLSRTGELTAIKASGLSMRRATVPVLLLTGMLCAVLFLVQDRITPGFNRKAQAVEDEIEGNPPRTYAAPATGQWSFGPDGKTLFHYRHYDPEQDVYQRFSIYTLDRDTPRILDHRYARKARLMGDGWELKRGWYRTLPPDDSPGFYENYPERHRAEVPPPTNFGTRDVRLASFGDLPEQLSLEELSEEIRSLEAAGYNVTRLKVDYHGKLARSLSPLVMVLLGLPFAFKVGRKGSLYGIGVALLLILVYWAVFAMFNALGLETILDPIVAAWAPNILFSLLGAYLMLYIPT
jgi:LPS export ABC transporter permease LptG/LPS export ABC transporter permease LptF